MKIVKFTYPHQSVGGYGCDKPGDMSGEYISLHDYKTAIDDMRRATLKMNKLSGHRLMQIAQPAREAINILKPYVQQQAQA